MYRRILLTALTVAALVAVVSVSNAQAGLLGDNCGCCASRLCRSSSMCADCVPPRSAAKPPAAANLLQRALLQDAPLPQELL